MIWAIPYKVNDSNIGEGVDISANENLYVSGTSFDVFGNPDILIVKYSQCPSQMNNARIINEENNSNNIQSNSLVKVFPNPNNGKIQITYSIKETETATFILYDLTGKKVSSHLLKGTNNSINLSLDLNAGTYYYEVNSNGVILAKDKLVIIK